MATIDSLKKTRLKKLENLRKSGIDPFPGSVSRTDGIKSSREKVGQNVATAGRIRAIREHGKIYFLDLEDGTGKVQVVIKSDVAESQAFSLIENLDIGDFVAVQGEVGKTQSGEISVFAKEIQILVKSLRPLPEKWYGLRDIEERYRQRYVDLIVNPEVKNIFITRSKIVSFLRKYLDNHGFLEVETPVLQPVYGGAHAKPFTTYHNTLDVNLYLRISDELYLKRLIVAGFDKVYEIGKDFRNEGIDRQHNPEFTMLEFYWAYADYEILMKFTEEMMSALVTELFGSNKISYQDIELDFTPPWPRKSYRDLILEYAGIDIDIAQTEEALRKAILDKKIQLDISNVVGYGDLLDALYKQTTRPHLTGPLFLIHRPTAFVSLAKRLPHDPAKTASFQLITASEELVNAYNELNDPQDQAARWHEAEDLAKRGQQEAEAFDHDYIRTLEYGMPPTAGWGLGVDRLTKIFTNQKNLKDVILFPTLRPEV